ncbi:conserved protein of unknown function [Pseudomonas marincola]|nr:conserved protein of unknown function [Pseudomonas marincola]
MIIAMSASKQIRLLLILSLRGFPQVADLMERVNLQKQQARNNNNKECNYLKGSLGSPCSFRSVNPRLISFRPTRLPHSMLESAPSLRSSLKLAGHFVKQCTPC